MYSIEICSGCLPNIQLARLFEGQYWAGCGIVFCQKKKKKNYVFNPINREKKNRPTKVNYLNNR